MVDAQYAIVLGAMAMVNGIKEDIPYWQAIVAPVFHGCFVIVTQEYSLSTNGAWRYSLVVWRVAISRIESLGMLAFDPRRPLAKLGTIGGGYWDGD